MADTDDRIELTDLDVIARYSLAVRTATADRIDLIATLRSDLEWLESLHPAPVRRTTAAATDRRPPANPAAPPTPRKAAQGAAKSRAKKTVKKTAKTVAARTRSTSR